MQLVVHQEVKKFFILNCHQQADIPDLADFGENNCIGVETNVHFFFVSKRAVVARKTVL